MHILKTITSPVFLLCKSTCQCSKKVFRRTKNVLPKPLNTVKSNSGLATQLYPCKPTSCYDGKASLQVAVGFCNSEVDTKSLRGLQLSATIYIHYEKTSMTRTTICVTYYFIYSNCNCF